MDPDTINARIAQRLAEIGMSQAELGRICHVNRSAVNQWISGTVQHIRPDHLVAIADALGLEIRWLITGRGPRLAQRDPPLNWEESDRDIIAAPKEIKQIFHQILASTRQKDP
jgi:transcriptional regulator with XRE-family HTH domain